MGYSIDNNKRVSNAKGLVIGTLDTTSATFVYADEDKKRYHAPLCKFMKTLGERVIYWEVEGVDRDGGEETSETSSPADIPPMPKKNPKMGDKTPGYVRWLERYHLEDFKARYGVTGRGVVNVVEDGKVVGQKETWLAKRKTCMTEVVSIPGGLDPNEYDWNAQ